MLSIRLHQRIDERSRADTQHHHIAWPDRPTATIRSLLRFRRSCAAMRRASSLIRRCRAFNSKRRPIGGAMAQFDRVILRRQRPDFDQARPRPHARPHVQQSLGRHHAITRRRAREDRVDGVEHGGAERNEMVRGTSTSAHGRRRRALEMRAHALRMRRVGALEAEDRLLGVADHEDRAAIARAPSPAKNSCQGRHHFPLFGIGVLRLIDGGCDRCRRRACRAPKG